ncbi:hypothetical protein GIB67_014344 [Kingdonia uniflora]|uniref:NADP-dependent oxidoreductase domain-containing protein n=1 Tax=Kingdonia uniflora TaxID=39325 RepID=A0A7J7NTW2_9MAGN|nr:hypothetical protein GIB67_014344 [Kingdonia uniflora]
MFEGKLIRKLSGVSHSSSSKSDYAVQLQIQDQYVLQLPFIRIVILDNGLLQVTFVKPGEVVSVIKYNGIENLLDGHEKEDRRGYWDLEWSRIGQCGRYNHVVGTEFKQMRLKPTWKVMEALVESGFVRAIGVSNFSVRQIKELLQFANIVPAVNQVELHPFWPQCRMGSIQCLCGRIGSSAADVTLIIHTSSAMPEVATSPASD